MSTSTTPATQSTSVHHPWATFASVLFIVGGVANVLWGWAALADAAAWGNTYPLIDSTFVGSLELWGWVSIGWAVALLAGAALLLQGHEAGRVLGITLATISAVFWLFALPAFPLYAVVVMALDILVIYGLVVHWEKHTV